MSEESTVRKLLPTGIPRREAVLALLLALMLALIAFRAPVFLSAGSLDTLVTDGALLAMMAVAQMLPLLTRGIDLSMAANMALTGMITALLSKAHPGMPALATIAIAIAIGLLLGAFNGSLIAYLGIPPIVVTLGTMSIYRGAVFLVSRGAWVNAQDFGKPYLAFPTARLLGLTHIFWIAVLVVAAAYVFLNHLEKGRELYALGGNTGAAKYVGINDSHNLLLVYLVTGVVSALCGYLWVARYAIAYTEIALGFELQTVAACVIGGVSIAGGRGTIAGCLLGSAFLVIVFNALPVINVSPFWQMAISGAVVLAAVILNSRGERAVGKLILETRRDLAEEVAP
jgi:rhamnose transport system permease protein